MTDIVERLRTLNADFLHEEAADEIERLRAALHKIAANADRTDATPRTLLDGCAMIAKRALSHD